MTSDLTKTGSEIWRDYDTDGVPSSGAHDPDKSDIRMWCAEIENTISNASVGAQYKFSTNTNTEADPGAGYITFNLGSPSPEAVTEIAISDTDRLGRELVNFWQSLNDSTTLANRATIIVRDATEDYIAVFRVNDAVIDEAGWTRIPVAWVDGTGGFADAAAVGIVASPTGNQGGSLMALSIFDPGAGGPVSGEILWRAPLPKILVFQAGLTESFGYCYDAPASDAEFTFKKYPAATPTVGAAFATATFAAGAHTATFALAADEEFAAGDILEVVAPDPKDATMTQPSFTLVGHLT